MSGRKWFVVNCWLIIFVHKISLQIYLPKVCLRLDSICWCPSFQLCEILEVIKLISENLTVQAIETSLSGSLICRDGPCGFSDAKTSSKDARERLASLRRLIIVVALCLVFMSVEVVGGVKANSLAILTDAADLLTDGAAFAISLFMKPLQGLSISAGEVQGSLMFLDSAFGLVVNISMALLLGHDHGHGQGHADHHYDHEDHNETHNHGTTVTTHHSHHHEVHCNHGHKNHHIVDVTVPLLKHSSEGEKKPKQQNINVQGTYLHVLGDSIQRIRVMIGGAIIWYKPEWKIVDLICTLVFSVMIFSTTIPMLRNILEVLMESTPREIDATKIEKDLCGMDEVVDIHELHIWAITVGKVLMACHVIVKPDANAEMVLKKVIDYVKRGYNINHVTIEIERQ
ncbi:metal tolerance protein 1-like [Pyrus ussuriensis x Pyrus communis]|uniref:Metal tolerance protein 1-like n=1 Tax=Pyrus ussuriensis x Pyrus communis TaxID=2448454 RepID=A0A5N5GZU3_9ROSA|nr:metal tolerance protein 1-like [Pyrus ussuriensis x Pyrus communis]